MAANPSLKQLIQEIVGKNMPQICIGVVLATTPAISIVLKDDIGVQLSNASLTIPSGKTPEVGEEWYMLAVSDRKVYYLLDRV